MTLQSILSYAFGSVAALSLTYATFLGLLTITYFQRHAIYLHAFQMTWGCDLDVPEQWGFMKNQVTPFSLDTPDGVSLHAWHILPLGLYRDHQQELCQEPSGFKDDVSKTYGYKLLRDDPNALLVIYLHGAGGTLGSGYRPPSYRAVSDGASHRIHVVAIDYRGFGKSRGQPSEPGLLTDAMTLVNWVVDTVGIPSSRIVIFGHSIGTAVGSSLVRHLASQIPPTFFAGIVFVAPFSDAETLTSTYKLVGTIPLLSPLARFPKLMRYFNGFIKDKMRTKEHLAEFIRLSERTKEAPHYDITIIHAEDDWDINWTHSEELFKSAVNATVPGGISHEALEERKEEGRNHLGAGGWTMEWKSSRGIIREEITKYGLHDRVMSYPIVSLAVLRAFGGLAKPSN